MATLHSLKVSLAGDVLFQGIQKDNPIYITPYVITGGTQEFNLNEAETEYAEELNGKFTGGLDAKYSYKSNITIDLTVNTDFAQVEADDQQINLNRFNLFFPEKRQFFQERSELFDIRTGGPNRIFYSRRIGLHDDQILPIYGGVRLTGNVRDHEIGLMNLQVGAADTIASENFTVARVKRQVLNQSSFVGGMFTNKMDFDGNFNRVGALDASLRLGKDLYLFTKVAHSFDDIYKGNQWNIDQSRVFVNLEKATYQGFVYDLSFGYSGEKYNPEMGFEGRDGFLSSWHLVRYGWVTPEHPILSRFRINSVNNIYFTTESSQQESQRNSLGFELFTKNGYGFLANGNHYFENIFEAFEIESDQTIDIGEYRFYNADITFNTPLTSAISLIAMVQTGQYFNGTNHTLSLTPAWNIGSGIQLSGYYQFSSIQFPQQDIANLHLGRIKMLFTLSTKTSFSSFVQYNSTLHSIVGNFRFRYNPREGNDLYIVYNDDFNTSRGREIPGLPFSSGRTLLVKYTYMFTL